MAALLCLVMASAQNAEKPVITFKTNIYQQYGPTNSFHFTIGTTEEVYIDVDCGAGPNEVLVKPAVYDSETQQIVGTSVVCNVGEDGMVRIYADNPELIDYFDASGCYIDWIDLGKCTNLSILNLEHNELKSLDLSDFDLLSALYLSDNPFTAETPLKIGTNHPDLTILEVAMVQYMADDFEIGTFSNLVIFDAYANASLRKLDPSNCPNLKRISVDSTPLTSLDVSKNTELLILNISDSRISNIDLSNNKKLTQLYATHDSGSLNTDCKLTSIDVSANTELIALFLTGNNLTSIDVSKNTKLFDLYLGRNQLTGINVDNNPELYNFHIEQNNMSFATLPLPNANWFDYMYHQRPMKVDRSYAVGSKIDLADRVLRNDTNTDAVLYAYNFKNNSTTVLDKSYYDYADGVVTLKKIHTDSLYVSFANSAFPGVTIETARFMVKSEADFGRPSAMASFLPGVGNGETLKLKVGMAGASADAPRTFYVDLGDGTLTEFTATCPTLPETPNVVAAHKSSGNVTVYIPENEALTALGTEGMPLYSINLNAADALMYLDLSGAQLYDIDLGYNRNLRSLNLSNNQLYNLSLEGVNGISSKNMLGDINLSHNNLGNVTLNDTRAIHNLDLSYNKLTEFSYKEFESIKTFNISHNQLQTVNLAYMAASDRVDVSYNALTEVMLPETPLASLAIEGNCFTLATLPLGAAVQYTYAPQAEIVIPNKAPGINLSAQNIVVDGTGTTYTWKTTDGRTLAEGTEVVVNNGGTRFLAPAVGLKVFCEMTNPAFPDFKGDNALRTTVIEAADMPTNMIANFTTTNAGETVILSLAAEKAGTALYIDWSGEGFDLEQYVLGSSFKLFYGTTIAGANVKVYTYSPEEHITVFSIEGATMADMDASGLEDAINITIDNAGLEDIKLPLGSINLRELALNKNKLTDDFDFSSFPNLTSLSINNNMLTSLDLSKNKSLQMVSASNNQIDKVYFDNPNLWLFYANDNLIADIDFSGATSISQLALNGNLLRTLDVSALKLVELQLAGNYFTFQTLPPVESNYALYIYYNQQPIEVEPVDGKVDLSSQAMVGTSPTEYHWFLGKPDFDETGNLVGEELYIDDEYTLDNGVTTFNKSFDGVMCVMTNEAFPKLYLYTQLLDVKSGVEAVRVDGNEEPVYYNLSGIRVDKPSTGNVYIVRRGAKATKELFR